MDLGKLFLMSFALMTAASVSFAAWKDTPGTYAVFETSMGRIVCLLFDKEAPKTVENFIGLAEGTREFTDPKTGQKTKHKFYDGLIFHRVIPGFMIQGGCPLGMGTGGPGYKFADEIVPSLAFDRPGRLAMANAGPGTNGSQFFITEVPTPWLNGRHTIFGQVVEGQELVNKIARVEKGMRDKPVKDILIKHLAIERVGGKEGKMEKKTKALEGKKILIIVAPEKFRDHEYFVPREILSGAGAEVVTASLKKGGITGIEGGKATSDLLIDDINSADYDAVVYVGGGGAKVLFDNAKAQAVAKEMSEKGKLVSAICIAPVIIARSGVLKGKKATVFESGKDDLINGGADYTGKPVEVDGQIITANGPKAARDFAEEILKKLSE
ncbi:MAG: peptidylprolyl isomerase [Endomicrobiales bacterium]|nr:peptidylprolyl isomerase [Endomicrobiales bacterium]